MVGNRARPCGHCCFPTTRQPPVRTAGGSHAPNARSVLRGPNAEQPDSSGTIQVNRGNVKESEGVPAGKEILYGTFTMGYPPTEKARTEKLIAVIQFKELKATLRTEPQELNISAVKREK